MAVAEKEDETLGRNGDQDTSMALATVGRLETPGWDGKLSRSQPPWLGAVTVTAWGSSTGLPMCGFTASWLQHY